MTLNEGGLARWIAKMRTPNVGFTDRVIRFFVGIGIFALGAFTGPFLSNYSLGILSLLIGVIGLVVLASGIFGFCFMYDVMGINTLKGKISHNNEETQQVTPKEQTEAVR